MFTLYLMSKKGYEVLNALIVNSFGQHIDQVVSSRDNSVLNDYYNEIELLCKENSLKFINRHDVGVVSSAFSLAISWRWLIETKGLIVLHDSLLPRYRGFAPLVSALINGDKQLGVTALFANREFDRGDIIMQKSVAVSYPMKINEVITVISQLYNDIVLDLVRKLVSNESIQSKKQDDAKATYSLWRDDDDYAIDWRLDSAKIERFINATGYPYKGAMSLINGKLARIIEAEQAEDIVIENRTPGKVIFNDNGFPVVVCGRGLLSVKKMRWEDGTNALPLKKFRSRFQ
jgi:methionyl-tRNA formyltransferase